MSFVLAVLGGAAAVELSKLLSKDKKVSLKELEVLQTKEEELQGALQEVQAELRREKAAHRVDSERVEELSTFAQEIQTVKTELQEANVAKTDLEQRSTRLQSVQAELEQESNSLKSDKQELLQKTSVLQQRHAELYKSAVSLENEKQSLTQQVEDLKQITQTKNEQLKSLTRHMENMKEKAVSAFKQYSQQKITAPELLTEFGSLGLQTDVTAEQLDALPVVLGTRDTGSMEEQLHADFSKQIRLVYDSPDRLSTFMENVHARPEPEFRDSAALEYRRDPLPQEPHPSPSARGRLTFPDLKSPSKMRQGNPAFSFLPNGGRLTPRQNDSNQSKVPALNLSSVGYQSPAKSPRRALQPTEIKTGNGTALVFNTKPPKESKHGSKMTLDLGGPSAERTTPRKVATPKRTRSSTAAVMYDRENQEPFDSLHELPLSIRQ